MVVVEFWKCASWRGCPAARAAVARFVGLAEPHIDTLCEFNECFIKLRSESYPE